MAASSPDEESRGRRRSPLAIRLSAVVTLLIVGALLLANATLEGLDTDSRQGLLWRYLFVAFGGGLFLALFLDIIVTRPTIGLVEQVREAARTNWASPIESPRQTGELQELAVALEELRKAVVSREEELNELNRDLEERVQARTRALERAQAQLVSQGKLAALGQLAAGVSHEVNNPNGIILSRSSYLLSIADEEGLDPDIIEDIEVIEAQSKRVAKVTRTLLSLGQEEKVEAKRVLLSELAALTVRLLKPRAEELGVELQIEIANEEAVLAEPSQLEQVLFNLLKNALESGASTVSIAIDGTRAAVRDNGEGISPEEQGRVFDPFFTKKPVGEGSGLGLSISHDIVEANGGTISLTSTPGEGSVFTVELPAWRGEE